MTGWLLDTDALSAFAPGRHTIPPAAADLFDNRADRLYLSVITVVEIETGIAKVFRTGATRRAGALRAWFERVMAVISPRPESSALSATLPKPRGDIQALPMSRSQRLPRRESFR